MISFSVLTKENINQIYEDIVAKNTSADREYLSEILSSLLEDDQCEIAVCAEDNCLFIRIFDEEYLFSYPVALADGVDEDCAIEKIRAYAVKEEIPLVICDIPAECLENTRSHFTISQGFAEDDDESSYILRVFSEISDFSVEFPVISGDVSLDMLTTSDEREYARLCRDAETNKYWGYNYKDDCKDATDSYFLDTAISERERGTAISLAVRYNGEFCGEAMLYAFDFHGGAEYAVRLLPEFRGRKIGSTALDLMLDFCRQIGMKKLYTTISKENIASRKAYEKRFALIEDDGKILRFAIDL